LIDVGNLPRDMPPVPQTGSYKPRTSSCGSMIIAINKIHKRTGISKELENASAPVIKDTDNFLVNRRK
jgi:hypothetical protein